MRSILIWADIKYKLKERNKIFLMLDNYKKRGKECKEMNRYNFGE